MEAFECKLFSAFCRRSAQIPFVKFVELNAFPYTFQYTTGALMNTHCMHSLHDGSSQYVTISGSFKSLVRMTFVWYEGALSAHVQIVTLNLLFLFLMILCGMYCGNICCQWAQMNYSITTRVEVVCSMEISISMLTPESSPICCFTNWR